MIQTHATYEVNEGALMADNNQVICIHNARVIVEPLLPVQPQLKAPRVQGLIEWSAESFCRCFVVAAAIYLIYEVVGAFLGGAIR